MALFSGKMNSWWFTISLPLVIGIFIFPSAYLALFNWLGPFTGPWLYPFLLYLYLLMANPLQWWVIGIIWIITGISAGLIAGTIKRSIPIFFLALITNFGFLGLSLIFLALNIQNNFSNTDLTGNILQLVAIIPPGLTYQLFTIPILGEILAPIIEAATAAKVTGVSFNEGLVLDVISNSLGGLIIGAALNMTLLFGTLLFGGYLRQFTPYPIEPTESDYRIKYLP